MNRKDSIVLMIYGVLVGVALMRGDLIGASLFLGAAALLVWALAGEKGGKR